MIIHVSRPKHAVHPSPRFPNDYVHVGTWETWLNPRHSRFYALLILDALRKEDIRQYDVISLDHPDGIEHAEIQILDRDSRTLHVSPKEREVSGYPDETCVPTRDTGLTFGGMPYPNKQ